MTWFRDNVELDETGTSLEVSVPGTYRAEAGSGTCAAQDEIVVTITEGPDVSIASQSLCQGSDATFEAGADDAFDHQWFIDGEEIANTTGSLVLTEAIINGTTAEVTVIATNLSSDGCTTTSSAMLEFISSPSLELDALPSFCEGSSSTVSTVVENVSTLTWFRDNVMLDETGLSLEVTEDGMYRVEAGTGPCAVSEEFTVEFADAPDVELNSVSSCAGQDAIFVAGDDDEFRYTWFVNDVEVSNTDGTLVLDEAMVPSNPATVRVVAMNMNNECENSSEATVEFISSPILSIDDLSDFCEGSLGMITTMTENVTTLSWFRDGEELSADGLSLEVEEDGLYLAVAGTGPCAVRDSVEVTFSSAPDVLPLSDLSQCAGEDAVFVAGDDDLYNYTWFLDGVEQDNTDGSFTVSSAAVMNNMAEVRVVATNLNDACDVEFTASVEFIDSPTLMIDALPDFCDGTPAVISPMTNTNSLQWFIDGEEQMETGTSFEATVGGEYMVIAGSGDCAVMETFEVVFEESPVIELSDLSACSGLDAEFVAGPDGIYTYEWTVDGVVLDEENGTLILSRDDIQNDAATVEVTATSNSGSNCTSTLSVALEFIAAPELTLDAPDAFCSGDMAVISPSNVNVSSLRWFLDGEELDETAIELEVFEEGEYLAIAGDGPCAVRDSVQVSFADSPDVSLDNLVQCTGEDAVFVAGADGAFNYTWFLNGEEQDNTSGTFVVQSGDITGTTATVDVIAVNLNNDCNTELAATLEFIQTPELAIQPVSAFCQGTEVELTTMTNVGSLNWFLDNERLAQNEPTITITEPGLYLAIAGDGVCAVRDSIEVQTTDAPVISLEGSDTGCGDEVLTLTLTSDTNADVTWFNGADVITGESGLTLEVSESGTYTAEVTNTAGCPSTETIEVEYFEAPTADLGMFPDGICEGVDFEVEASSDGESFTWQDISGTVLGDGLTQIFNSSGSFVFVAANEFGCTTEIPFELEFRPAPSIDLGDNETFCEGETVTLSVPLETNVTYEWQRNGESLSEDSNMLEVSEAGDYTLIATNDIDCSSSDNVLIAVVDLPSLSTTSELEFCEGESVILDVETNADNISWTLGGQEISDTRVTEVTEGGTYTVTVSTPEGCSMDANVEVEQISIPAISFTDFELCPGDDPQQLVVDGNFDTYSWTGEVTSNEASVVVPWRDVQSVTTEVINITAARGECSSQTSVQVTYFPAIEPVVPTTSYSICIGESVDLSVGGGSNYSWTDPNGSLSNSSIANPVASPTTTTTYEVMIGDICPNNFETVAITVTVNELPVADAGPDKSTVPGEPVTLEASGGSDYQWDNTDFILGSSTISSPEVDVEETTVFTVTVTDNNGCTAVDQVTVDLVNDPGLVVNIVDAISPNGDSKNDFLEFDGLDLFPDNKLTVFNRWGNIVFEKRGYQNDEDLWDGTRNGDPLPAAVYYYILEFGEFRVENSLTIIRD